MRFSLVSFSFLQKKEATNSSEVAAIPSLALALPPWFTYSYYTLWHLQGRGGGRVRCQESPVIHDGSQAGGHRNGMAALHLGGPVGVR